jgi:uncharacterized protein DUF4396
MSVATTIAWASLVVAALCSIFIIADIRKRPQPMKVMAFVWPLCALFGGPLLLAFYLVWGRAPEAGEDQEDSHQQHGSRSDDAGPAYPVTVAKGALHCGAGCSLGDICAETLAALFPLVLVPFGFPGLFEEKMFATWGLDFLFAFVIGIVFQYFAIVPMRDLSPGRGIVEALKADALSLISWQVGMYGAMAIGQFAILDEPVGADTAMFWFIMQFAMIAGFITAYPTNWFLIRAGIKEKM